MAGAVKIAAKKPTGEFGLLATGGGSNFSGYTGELHVDLPKFAGFSVKLDGVLTGRNGWVDNPRPQAEDFGGYDRRAARARVLWEPMEDLTFDYAYDTAYDATTTLYQQFLGRFPGNGVAPPATLAPAAANTASTSRVEKATLSVPQQESVGNTWGHRLTGAWRISDTLMFKSITSYRDPKQDQWDNGSAALSAGAFQATAATTSFAGQQYGRYSLALFKQNQTSQEFQVIGDTDRLKWVAGAIYYREHVIDNARALFTSQFTDVAGVASVIRQIDYLSQRIDRASQVTTKSLGAFAQATYTPPVLNDALHVTLGGRWTRDEKVGRMRTINDVNFPIGSEGRTFFAPSAPTIPLLSPNPMNAKWERFDPVVNVACAVSNDIMVYARYSTGYKSGGSNSRSLTYRPFDPEDVKMAEIGAKMEFLDNRARLNLAAYDGDYTDIQLDFSAPYLITNANGTVSFTNRTTTETINSPGKGKLNGFEADFTFAATDFLTLSASYAYNKVDIPATRNPFLQANGQVIAVAIPIYQVYTPENSASFAIDFEAPFRAARFVAHLDANYGDGYYANYTDLAYDPVTRAVTMPNPKGDSSLIVNGRLSLADIPAGDGLALISIWSRNLLNDEHVFAKFVDPRQGFGGFFNDPRTFGIELAVKL